MSRDVGVPLSCIYGWTKKYGKVQAMNNKPGRKPSDRKAQEKFQLVIKYFSLPDEERGKFLRENGLHSDHLEQWKRMLESGLDPKPKSSSLAEDKKKIKELEKEIRRKDKALAEAAALLILQKKSQSTMGNGRGRVSLADRTEKILLIDEACTSGARREKCCELYGLSIRTLERWELTSELEDGRKGPNHSPHALNAEEKDLILAVANSEKYRDLSPAKIVPTLADEGKYIASESSFFRVLLSKK